MALYLTLATAFLAFVGFTSTRMLLSLYALNLGATPFSVGVISALFWIFPMLLSWPVGVASDRFGARWLLVAGSGAGTLALLTAGWFHSLPAVYAAAALGGIMLSVYNVVSQNVVGLISKPEERTRNFGTFMVFGSTSGFIGPAITGLCIDHLGFEGAARVMVAAPLLGLLLLGVWGGSLPTGHGRKRPPGSLAGMVAGRGMPSALVLGAIVTLGTDMFQFYLPVYGHRLGLSASAIGAITAILSLAMFSTRVLMPRLVARLGEQQLLTVVMSLGAAAYLIMPFAGNVFVLGAVAAMFGLSMGCSQPLTMMLMYSLSAAGRAGETLGLRLTVNNVFRVIGPMLFGSIGTAFGMLPMFWLNALLLGGGGVISNARERFGSGPAQR
jgi:MFS family permease